MQPINVIYRVSQNILDFRVSQNRRKPLILNNFWDTAWKNASLQQETSNQCFKLFNITFQHMQSFFDFLVAVMNCYILLCVS